MAGSFESLPLPDDPTLAAWAVALNEAGYWAYVLDASWRYAFATDDLRQGRTLYMGRVNAKGRSELTALGDEMNETARIEACATGGRALASKSLIERLDQVDADAIALEYRHLTYTPLAELATATDKARRDAPAIAVCEV
jgi:class 3 adenylate cyclase